MKFYVLMTSHNRVETTVRCLKKVRTIAEEGDHNIRVTLVDAGSTDGTAEKAGAVWENVTVSQTDSDVFWAEGMALAEKYVFDNFDISSDDFIIWLNDDVLLDDNALDRALKFVTTDVDREKRIYIGAMRSQSGATTYGGLTRSSWNPLGICLVSPTKGPITVDTFHGNFVLVAGHIAKGLGGIDGQFGHHMADIDYGIRNTQLGNRNVLLPGTFGVCETNGPNLASRRERWRFYRSIRGGGHWPTRLLFLKKHSWVPGTPALLAMDIVHALRLARSPRPENGEEILLPHTEAASHRD